MGLIGATGRKDCSSPAEARIVDASVILRALISTGSVGSIGARLPS